MLFRKNLFGMFDSHKNGPLNDISCVSENFLTSSWWVCNKAPINQLFVPYRKFSDLSLMYGPHFIRPVRQSCGPNILPCGQLVNKSIKLKDLSTVEQHLVGHCTSGQCYGLFT